MTRAVLFHEAGGPDVLRFEEVEVGMPGPDEVRVRSEAVAVSRGESLFREGGYFVEPKPPCRFGAEGSAIIEQVGANVSGFAVGDRVCFMPTFYPGSYGMCAEVALMPAASTLKAPTGLDPIEVAATWVSYSTAFALIEIAGLRAGDTVLVTAASSSVGLAAIQTIRARGGIPIAVTRKAAKIDALLSHGAEHVVATEEMGLVEEVLRITGGGARLAFDAVAGPALESLCAAMAQESTVLLYGNLSGQTTPLPLAALATNGLSLRGFVAPRHIWGEPDRMARCKAFVQGGIDDGWLKPAIDRVFGFEDVVAAHRYLDTNDQVGKVVVAL